MLPLKATITLISLSISATSLCFAQQPKFGNPGIWEVNILENGIFDGEKDPPFKDMKKGCASNAQLKGIADPPFQDLHPAARDQVCSYTNIKDSGNTISWSYQCEGKDKRTRSKGTVKHEYRANPEQVSQKHLFNIEFLNGPRWVKVSGDGLVTAKRLGACPK